MVSPLPLRAWSLVSPGISAVVAIVWAPLADCCYLFDLGEFSLIFNLIFASRS